MKNVLKGLSLSLFLAMVITFVGCQTTQQPQEQQQEQTVGEEQQGSTEENINLVEEAAKAYFANMPEDVYKINQETFIDKVKAGEDVFIVDIRKADAYEAGHVKDAINLPWGTAISDNLEKLPKDKPIMVYCYTGQTAGQTVALLNVAGFDAKSVNYGWDRGISKVEGYEEVVENAIIQFPKDVNTEINPEVKAALVEYFEGLAEVKDTKFANYKISEDNAKELLDTEDPSIQFVSVRKADDYAKGHIQGAVNVPFSKGMEESFTTLSKDKKLVVYCYSGQTAGQTVAILKLLGYDAVSLNSGMGTPVTAPSGWVNKEYPVVQ